MLKMEIILCENTPFFFFLLFWIDFIMLVRNFAITCFSLNDSHRLNINNFLGELYSRKSKENQKQ